MTVESLARLDNYKDFDGPVLLVIMDGVGLGDHAANNAIYSATTPTLDRLMSEELATSLAAHGKAVGLPTDGDMGNSEVGHNALGAGRIFSQGAQLVEDAISSGAIFTGEAWQSCIKRGLAGGTVHLLGLLSDGNVHSHIRHLFALLDGCVAENLAEVRVHVLLDGRDVEQKSALIYLDQLETKLASLRSAERNYCIASGGGRMRTTMDRYGADWSIVERGWRAHVQGIGRCFSSAHEAVQTFYDEEMTDQYMDPFVVVRDGIPLGTIEDGDAVICFNFRGDRAIEISEAFEEEEFTAFDRQKFPKVYYAGMMQYDGDASIPSNYLVQPPQIEATLSDYLCASQVSSFAISETQKFGHVTYFWNGNRSGYIDPSLEEFVEIPSDKVTFDQRPWMKSAEITDVVIAEIEKGEKKFIRLNYPNADMVGHTGVPLAVQVAVESVDLSLARLQAALEKAGGIMLVTADHGNADCIWKEKDGRRLPMVAHTLNPVPCVIKDYSGYDQFKLVTQSNQGVANVAATLCVMLGFVPPADYEPSLLNIS